jgi:predicted AAA+ superfamily ATPase
MKMRPMSLFESGESNGTISLKSLFDGETNIDSTSQLTIEELAYTICRGGWPGALDLNKEDALEIAYNYCDSIAESDASEIDKSKKDPDRVRNIMRSLARNISTMTTDKTIIGDVKANDISLTDKTLETYLRALRKLFVVEDIKAWQPSLRSKTGIRTSDKRQFVDPSIAVASLGIGPEGILEDFKYFGFLFESLCARDLRVYTEGLRGTIKHYHDNNDLEADLIICLHDGRWAAVEVKLGSQEIEDGAENLKKLASNIDTSKFMAPSFLMVLTGGEFAYRREDGVFIVPIGCLRD